MTESEILAQMFLQAQNLRDEIEALRAIDVDAMIERAFNNVFGEEK